MDDNQRNAPLSVGGWIGTLIVLAIPLVGLIMTFVWAFGNGNTSRKNFFIAYLILALIAIAICIVVWFIVLVPLGGINAIKEMYPMKF